MVSREAVGCPNFGHLRCEVNGFQLTGRVAHRFCLELLHAVNEAVSMEVITTIENSDIVVMQRAFAVVADELRWGGLNEHKNSFTSGMPAYILYYFFFLSSFISNWTLVYIPFLFRVSCILSFLPSNKIFFLVS